MLGLINKPEMVLLVLLTLLLLLGAGDDSARFNVLGHRRDVRLRMQLCIAGVQSRWVSGFRPYAWRIGHVHGYAGRDDNLVFQTFVQKYGPAVVLAPPKSGFGTAAWIMPYIALLAGVSCSSIQCIRVWNKRPAGLPASVGGGSADPDGT